MQTLKLLLLTALFFITSSSFSQKRLADSVYNSALRIYEAKDTLGAIKEFEKVLQFNRKHMDARFNLAALNLMIGNDAEAIRNLQLGVQLGDGNARAALKEMNIKIDYADTMYYAYVDALPIIRLGNREEPVFLNGDLHPRLRDKITTALQSSRNVQRKDGRIQLNLIFDKEGKLNAHVLFPKGNVVLQETITKKLAGVTNLKPGVYDGKPVVVQGMSLPVFVD